MKFRTRSKCKKDSGLTEVIGATVDETIEMEVEDGKPDEDSLLHMILLSNSDTIEPITEVPDTFTDFSFGQYDESTASNLKLLGNSKMFDL